MPERVIIIGGGIVGAAIAWHLGRAGREVLVIEAGMPGQGASGRSFGWVNASFHADEHHHHLRAASMVEWHAMAADLPKGAMRFWGALIWDEPPAALAAMAERLQGYDYHAEVLDRAAFEAHVPQVATPPDAALFFGQEGAADAGEAARCWLARPGVTTLTGLRVTGITEKGGRATGVDTETGPIAADQVVLAAGVATPELLAPLGLALPMLRRPGLLLRTRPVACHVAPVLVTPFGEVRQDASGRFLASTVPGHQGDSTEAISGSPEDHAHAVMTRLQEMLPGQGLELEAVSMALRPMPADGLPAIGPMGPEGLYVATLHSGVTLAPIVGKLVAAELAGKAQAMLEPYRPTRFAGG